MGALSYKPDGEWNRTAEVMMLQFAGSGPPVFRCTSPLSRRTLRRNSGGKTSERHGAEPQSAERLSTTIIAVHQLIIYGAVAKQPVEPQGTEGAGLEVPPHLVTRPTKHRTLRKLARGNLVHKLGEEFKETSDTRKVDPSVSRWRTLIDSCQRARHYDQISNRDRRTRHHEFVSRIHASSRRVLKLPEGNNWEHCQDWTCSGCIGYRSLQPVRS